MSFLPDFSDPRLPTLVVGHPGIMNFRGEEIALPEELLEKAMEELERLEEEVETTEPYPDFGRDALRRVYAIVDLVGDAVGAGMSCRPGCSACCRVMVATTAGEAALMGDKVARTPSGQQSAWKKSIGERNALLDDLASKNTPPSDLTVFGGLLATCEMYERENQPCPFLGPDKLCGIPDRRIERFPGVDKRHRQGPLRNPDGVLETVALVEEKRPERFPPLVPQAGAQDIVNVPCRTDLRTKRAHFSRYPTAQFQPRQNLGRLGESHSRESRQLRKRDVRQSLQTPIPCQ